jgi:hypothetical protein
MRQSMMIFALALSLSAGLAAAAYADQTAPAPTSASPSVREQSAQMPTLPPHTATADPYAASLTRNDGPYDQGDAYASPYGTPFPGWAQMSGQK